MASASSYAAGDRIRNQDAAPAVNKPSQHGFSASRP
jgi:hypothetical protein